MRNIVHAFFVALFLLSLVPLHVDAAIDRSLLQSSYTDNSQNLSPDYSVSALLFKDQDSRLQTSVSRLQTPIIKSSSTASSSWSSDPNQNTPVSTAANDQLIPQIVSDGAGGAIITWMDSRSDVNYDIYAQRLNSTGSPQWTANGVVVSAAASGQQMPQIVSDGSGGAIITWMDYRSGTNWDIYAQRVDAGGTAKWTADGVPVATAAFDQQKPQIVSDGTGGAIITWYDLRSGTNNDIYAQRLNGAGAPQWTVNGVPVSTAADNQLNPKIVYSGTGGAIIIWMDYRSGTTVDIYAQKLNGSGVSQWTADGAPVATAADNQLNPQLTSDGTGGAIITWMDFRSGTNWDIYAQRLNGSGAPQWTAVGVPVSTAAFNQSNPQLTSDGSGGAFITWYDFRSGADNDIYAQRVNGTGTIQWTANGAPVSTAPNDQTNPQIINHGAGSAIITWQDSRSGTMDIYAQRLDGAGTARWTANGVAVSTAPNGQTSPQLTSDDEGGAIITWYDFRSGANNNIYAQWINVIGSLTTMPLSWSSDPGINTPVSTAAFTQSNPAVSSDGTGGAVITWQDFRSGGYDIYTQRLTANGVPQWTANGLAISTAANDQTNPQLTSDGTAGAIITWQDQRPGSNWDIYAQRVNGTGTIQWTANGAPVSTAAFDQTNPQIVSDGTGGAIITWLDFRTDGAGDIYAQRLNAVGSPIWTANGIPVSTAAFNQSTPQIASDGSGGAIITWRDQRNGTDYDIYAQRLNSSGTPQWTANGVVVSNAAFDQSLPQIIPNAGGAIITWQDFRSNTDYDIYAQKLNGTGTPQWTANGMPVASAAFNQAGPQLTSDGSGGTIITWYDFRSGSHWDIYSQRLNASGIPLWTANGLPVSAIPGNADSNPQIRSDGTGGAIIAWLDLRSGANYDIYAQRLNSAGAPQWTADGAPVSTAAFDQTNPHLVSDGQGGAILTWQDFRTNSDFDIYAQRIYSSGVLGGGGGPDTTPPPAPTPIFPSNGFTVPTATPTFIWTDVTDDQTPPVRYELQVASNPFTAPLFINQFPIASSNYTLTGAQALASGTWFWRIRARDSVATPNYSAWTSPPWSFNVILGGGGGPPPGPASTTFLSGWNMWSYPLQPNPGSNFGQLSSYISTGFVFHYNATTGIYDITDVATSGWGYWTRVNFNTPVSATGSYIISPTFEIPLGSAWNQIGQPYNANIDWKNVSFRQGIVTKSLIDASAAGWISQYLYSYNTSAGLYEIRNAGDGVLRPFAGYWLLANQPGVTLIIPSP